MFRREGWDWRWFPFRQAARQALRWTGRFAGLPQDVRIAFAYEPRPEAVVLDLAIQAAGRTSAPQSGAFPDPSGSMKAPIPPWDDDAVPPAWEGEPPEPGGALVRAPGGEPVDLPQSSLIRMAEDLQSRLPLLPAGAREILVLAGPLERPEERALLSWATVAGAALLLEPDPGSLVGTAVWARPTVFAGTMEEAVRLRQAVERQGRRWFRRRSRLPFGRLRAVVVTDSQSVASEEEAFWNERGVGLLPHSGKAMV
ncbi:MAG TPA: hypothetical protein VF756_12500 [Thermoanaerobaculia bacterium]